MNYFRLAALTLLVPCAAFANTTEDVRAGGLAIIPSLGLSIDVAGNSGLQNHTPFSHAIDMGFAYAHATHKQKHELGDGPIISRGGVLGWM